eukprot:2512619-Rhodomonas_salina.2
MDPPSAEGAQGARGAETTMAERTAIAVAELKDLPGEKKKLLKFACQVQLFHPRTRVPLPCPLLTENPQVENVCPRCLLCMAGKFTPPFLRRRSAISATYTDCAAIRREICHLVRDSGAHRDPPVHFHVMQH